MLHTILLWTCTALYAYNLYLLTHLNGNICNDVKVLRLRIEVLEREMVADAASSTTLSENVEIIEEDWE
jgi:hypothetical protein